MVISDGYIYRYGEYDLIWRVYIYIYPYMGSICIYMEYDRYGKHLIYDLSKWYLSPYTEQTLCPLVSIAWQCSELIAFLGYYYNRRWGLLYILYYYIIVVCIILIWNSWYYYYTGSYSVFKVLFDGLPQTILCSWTYSAYNLRIQSPLLTTPTPPPLYLQRLQHWAYHSLLSYYSMFGSTTYKN